MRAVLEMGVSMGKGSCFGSFWRMLKTIGQMDRFMMGIG